MRLWGNTLETPVAHVLGGEMAEEPLKYVDASPVEFVRDDLPPTLLITGMLDSIVPPVHAESLANRLSAHNTPAVLLRVPWSRHAFDAVMPGLGAQVVQYNIDRFLAWSFYHGG
jgi:acetyl esterase/lipase